MSSCLSRSFNTASPPSWYTKNATGSDLLEARCLGLSNGLEMSFEDWSAQWSAALPDGRSCVQLFRDLIHSNSNRYSFSSSQMSRVQNDFDYMLRRYFNQNQYDMASIGDVRYTPFQSTLISACAALPGVCNPTQQQLCSRCSRAEISAITDLTRFCGCYSPDLDFNLYRMTPIEKACDPMCSGSLTVPIADANGNPLTCSANICVLDAISIQATQSLVGNISISQTCNTCTTSNSCICIIDTSVISAIEGAQTYAQLTQSCPSENAQCLVIDSIRQTSQVVPCGTTYKNSELAPENEINSEIPWWLWIVIAIGLGLFVIAILIALESLNGKRVLLPTFLSSLPDKLNKYTSSRQFRL